MESELKKELTRLQERYKAGQEIELIWKPIAPLHRPRFTRADGKVMVVNGEWTNGQIKIYEDQDLDKAMHTLHHEFAEMIILSDLVDPYVILSNALQNVFRTLTYISQEKLIEKLAKLEDEEYEKTKRKRVK